MASDNVGINFVEYMKGVGDSAVNIAKEGAYGVYDFGQVVVGGSKILAKEGLSAIGQTEAAAAIGIDDIQPLSSLGKIAAQGGYSGLGQAVKAMPGNIVDAIGDAAKRSDMRALGSAVTDGVLLADGVVGLGNGVVSATSKAGRAIAETTPKVLDKAKTALGKAKASGNPESTNSATAKCSKENDVVSRQGKTENHKVSDKLKPTLDEINLAKSNGNTQAHMAARDKVSRYFMEENGFTSEQINDALGSADGKIVGGVDLSKPVEIMQFPPPENMSQYVKSHGYPGNWFDPKGFQTADSLGISGEGRQLKSFKMPSGQGLLTHSNPIIDTWTNPNTPINTSGGGQQLFVNDVIKNQVINLNNIGM